MNTCENFQNAHSQFQTESSLLLSTHSAETICVTEVNTYQISFGEFWNIFSLQEIIEVVDGDDGLESKLSLSLNRIELTDKAVNQQDAPSPFKDVLFWPRETDSLLQSTTRKKEKLPSVVSSNLYKEYFAKKEEKKNEKENLKKRKGKNRQLKNKSKDNTKQLGMEKFLMKK